MNRAINWDGANYKDWIGLPAAVIFWVASLICFVLGLAFKTGTGIYIPGTLVDVALMFTFGLGLANTIIQIVGNDTDREDLGMALLLMWGASYMLGIGSNVNFLNGIIGLNNPLLQFLVCWGLGIMIEVAPERLMVKFLRAIGVLKSPPTRLVTRRPDETNSQPAHKAEYKSPAKRVTNREEHIRDLQRQHGQFNSQKRPDQRQPIRPVSQVPNTPEQDIPQFMKDAMWDASRAKGS